MNQHPDLAIQLHSLRDLGDPPIVFAAAAAAGFQLVEPVGLHLMNPEATAAQLAAHGLTAPTCHIQMERLRENLDGIAAACRAIGTRHLFVPAVPPEERDAPPAHWPGIGRELAAMARRLADHGIVFGYHNHYEVSIEDGERTALDMIFEESTGSPLVWQADVAWLFRCGRDPATLLDRYRDRLVSVHVKDRLVPPLPDDAEDNWRVAGQGGLRWPVLWRHCKDLGAGLMVMEHDRPRDPAAFARDAFAAGTLLGGIA